MLQGDVALARGRQAKALIFHRDALSIALRSGSGSNILECLEAMASSIAELGEPEKAVTLWSAADHERSENGMPLLPLDASVRGQRIAALRTALTGDVFEKAWVLGRALSLREATTRALEVARSRGGAERTGQAGNQRQR